MTVFRWLTFSRILAKRAEELLVGGMCSNL
jgi:hypothetical protein